MLPAQALGKAVIFCALLFGGSAPSFAEFPTMVNPAVDLQPKGSPVDSWYTTSNFQAEDGHQLNCLIHLMTIDYGTGHPQFARVTLGITDTVTGLLKTYIKIYPLSAISVSKSEGNFEIRMPDATWSGNTKQMSLQATLPGGFSIKLVTHFAGPILYNNGSGVFPFLGVPTYEYAFPKMETSGTVTLKDNTYHVSGSTWFDRQWMDQPVSDLNTDKFKWTWMNFRLSNGDAVSLWDVVYEGKDQAWAIVVSPDGTHTLADVIPLAKSASDFWVSPESGRRFPTNWEVRIPALQGVLEVTANPKGQEISSAESEVGRAVYEGASTVTGTYKGEKVTGSSYTEMVGGW